MRSQIPRILLPLVCTVLLANLTSNAQTPPPPPGWWTTTGTRIIQSRTAPNNYGPVNQGQLQHVAEMAKNHLDLALIDHGGAGPAIDNMVAGFQTSTPANFAPVNLGQLKAVAEPFYNRLLSLGYDANQNLIDRGYPANWAGHYPWSYTTPVAENYAPATIGQLKMVFSFQVPSNFVPTQPDDTDADGLPDWWEMKWFGEITSYSGSDPSPGDSSITVLQAYLEARNPHGTTSTGSSADETMELVVFLPL